MKYSYKKYINKDQSEFSHRYACWANNHMGWAKAKKANKKIAKKREKRELDKQIRGEQDYG